MPKINQSARLSGGALRHMRCGKGQQARGNGKGDKRIVATGLKGKRCRQCQACKGRTDAGQRIKRPLFFGGGRRELTADPRHRVTSSPAARTQEEFASPKQGCRREIASNDRPVRPAANAAFQHHRCRTIPEAEWSARPISAARSHVRSEHGVGSPFNLREQVAGAGLFKPMR